MQTHFSRYDVKGDSDRPWAPLCKIAFGLTSPPLTNSQNNRVAYAADMLDCTLQFNLIAPRLIEQPTHLLNQLGKRNGRGKPSIDRCVDSLEAYRKQKPVSTKRSNEMIPVPDPRKYPPPPMPPTGTADEAHDMVDKWSRVYAEEDAQEGTDPVRGDYKPAPPEGCRWSSEFLDAWTEANYPAKYARVFYTVRASIDATKAGVKWAKEDLEDVKRGAPRRTIIFVGRSPNPAYAPTWSKVATNVYNARLDEWCRLSGPSGPGLIAGPSGPTTPGPSGPGLIAGPSTGPSGAGPTAGPSGPTAGPSGAGPTAGPSGPTAGPGRSSLDILQSDAFRALCSLFAYERASDRNRADASGQSLVAMLRAYGFNL